MRKKKEINVQIGKQIKQAREEGRLTQEQLAEAVDVSPQYVSDLERGVVGVSLGTLRNICLTLGVSSDRILFSKATEFDFSLLEAKCRTLSREQLLLLSDMVSGFVDAILLEQKNKALSQTAERENKSVVGVAWACRRFFEPKRGAGFCRSRESIFAKLRNKIPPNQGLKFR